jgi:hypothetical protein
MLHVDRNSTVGGLAATATRECPDAAGARLRNNSIFKRKNVPADGSKLPTGTSGDFGTSPIFFAALGQANNSPYLLKWGLNRKAQ